MLSGKDIIITGLQSWNFGLGSNIANMAKILARKNRVLFVNYALDRTTLWRRSNDYIVQQYKKSKASGKLALEEITPGLVVFTPDIVLESINQLGPPWLFDFLNARNSKKFAQKIRKAADQLHLRDFILLSDSDFYRSFHLPEILEPSASLYYIRDNMIATDYYRKHGPRMERKFIEKVNLVIANSEVLATYAREFNPNSYDVGQGCDLDLYDSVKNYTIPDDLKLAREKFPVCIGYTGALKIIRIDEPLLYNLASSQPSFGFVFVGPEDAVFQDSKLHRLPNVFFLGRKPEKLLPSYLFHFDVAINPQIINDITQGNYPRKIDEYLAMGIPVVATETETMKIFRDHTYLARTQDEFTERIGQALKENNPELIERRKELARQHTWENNISRINTAFDKVMDGKKVSAPAFGLGGAGC
ncbi:MAG: glycosyltransferase [Bacteroidota bacterium]